MQKKMQQEILQQYGFDKGVTAIAIASGLINTTWLVTASGAKYVLQRINKSIFKNPPDIAFNICSIGDYFNRHYPNYLFTHPVKTIAGAALAEAGGEYYRLFSFIERSHTIDVVQSPAQAYEAARQFAGFAKRLSRFDAATLKVTLPNFHNLPMRYRQFEESLKNAAHSRLQLAAKEIRLAIQYKGIVQKYEALVPHLPTRVTHHDTKISNVLFDENDRGLCVIDLDTVMPGYFTSDVGDMLRTYVCPVSEEEKDIEKVMVRSDFYMAIKEGYLSEMHEELNMVEKENFLFAGEKMIYMQALRFLTDYLNNDVYYGAAYEEHNLVRATNQLALLQQIITLSDIA